MFQDSIFFFKMFCKGFWYGKINWDGDRISMDSFSLSETDSADY